MLETVIDEFTIQVVLAEELREARHAGEVVGARTSGLVRGTDGACLPRRQDDQALLVTLEELQVDTRAVVDTLEDRARDELTEVPVPDAVLNQEHELEGVVEAPLAVPDPPRIHPEHRPVHTMDLHVLAGLVEGHGPVEVAGVGERQ